MKSLVVWLGLAAFWTSAWAQVERATFDASPFALGPLSRADGALGQDLWAGSKAEEVRFLLLEVPTRYDDSAKRMMLRRVLLSPGEGPAGADSALAALKLLKAAQAGYVMEAGAVAALTPGLSLEPGLSRIVAMRELYRGEVDKACARGASLREGRQQPFFIRLRALCYIRAGEQAAAELTINLAREEGVFSPEDDQFFRALLRGEQPTGLPTTAVHYAGFRQLGVAFAPDDVAIVGPAIAAAMALDDGLEGSTRLAAIHRAAMEDLLSSRDLMDAAAALVGTRIGDELAALRPLAPGTEGHARAIGNALENASGDPAGFLLRTKIFEADIASLTLSPATAPYTAELALASLLNRRFTDAERWMQAVATETSMGAERAFLNLAQFYSILQPGPAQRLAGAIGERLANRPRADFIVPDSTALATSAGDLPVQVVRGLDAAASGSRASLLLAALGTAAVEGISPRIEEARDVLGRDLYRRARAEEFVFEAAFRADALRFAGRIRDEVIGAAPYVPRLKPER